MKKIILFSMIFLFSGFVLAEPDYDEINRKLNECKWNTSCHQKLMNQYYSVVDLRYFYAKSLIYDKRYIEAKDQLNAVINHHRASDSIKQKAKNELKEIDLLYKKMENAQKEDYGNYLNEISQTYTLPNPSNIKVYIKSDTGWEYLLKKAFAKWDYELYQLINFSYVTNEDDADIICSFVEKLDGDKIGITYYDYYYLDNEQYFRPRIEISQKDPYNNSYHTQKEVISISLHEIGHALGMMGHSSNLNDIMYYSSKSYKNGTLSRKDINTVRKLYSN